MPSANTRARRSLLPHHLFNQGALLGGRRPRDIFIDSEDRRYFLYLLARHLGQEPANDRRGRQLQHLRPLILLLAFCLMTTRFHLIVWQRDPAGIELLINRVTSAYTRYFNQKYGNTEPLFRGPVRAKPIASREYFRWLVGYVHDNHPSGVDYEFSSHTAWVNPEQQPGWLDLEPALKVFGGVEQYADYLEQRTAKRTLDRELGFGKC